MGKKEKRSAEGDGTDVRYKRGKREGERDERDQRDEKESHTLEKGIREGKK